MSAIPAHGARGAQARAGRDAVPGDHGLAPAGLRLIPDPGTRLVAGGTVLVGGSPVRLLRLTPAGARQVASWFAGSPVPDAAAARALARRVLDAGIAHPQFAASTSATPGPAACGLPTVADVTVVIPVRDRHAELDRCLGGPGRSPARDRRRRRVRRPGGDHAHRGVSRRGRHSPAGQRRPRRRAQHRARGGADRVRRVPRLRLRARTRLAGRCCRTSPTRPSAR